MGVFFYVYSVFVFIADFLQFLILFCWRYVELLIKTIVPPKRKSINGQIAVITGAGNGMGKEVAIQLAELGAYAVCWDINKEGAEATVKEIVSRGGQARAWMVDVADRNAVLQAAKEVQQMVGQVTILINNAGIMPCRPFSSFNHKQIQRIIEINTFSQFWTLEAFLPQMKHKKQGHIVSMCSVASRMGSPNLVPYCASKYACLGLMDALEIELRHYGAEEVKLTSVFPFIVATGLVQKPRVRFPAFLQVFTAKQAAELIIDGMLRNKHHVWIPDYLKYLHYTVQSWPRKAAIDFYDFMDTGCEPHDETGWRNEIANTETVVNSK